MLFAAAPALADVYYAETTNANTQMTVTSNGPGVGPLVQVTTGMGTENATTVQVADFVAATTGNSTVFKWTGLLNGSPADGWLWFEVDQTSFVSQPSEATVLVRMSVKTQPGVIGSLAEWAVRNGSLDDLAGAMGLTPVPPGSSTEKPAPESGLGLYVCGCGGILIPTVTCPDPGGVCTGACPIAPATSCRWYWLPVQPA